MAKASDGPLLSNQGNEENEGTGLDKALAKALEDSLLPNQGNEENEGTGLDKALAKASDGPLLSNQGNEENEETGLDKALAKALEGPLLPNKEIKPEIQNGNEGTGLDKALAKALAKSKQIGGKKSNQFVEKVIHNRLGILRTHNKNHQNHKYKSFPKIVSNTSDIKQSTIFGGNIMPMYENKIINANKGGSKDENTMKDNTLAQKDENSQMYIDFLSEWKFDYTDSYDRIQEQVTYLNNKFKKLKIVKDNFASALGNDKIEKDLRDKIKDFETTDINLKLDSSITDFITQNDKFSSEIKTNKIFGKHISQFDKTSLIEASKRLSSGLRKLERRTKNLDISNDFDKIRNDAISLKTDIKQYLEDKSEYDEKKAYHDKKANRGDYYREKERDNQEDILIKKKKKLSSLLDTIETKKESVSRQLRSLSFDIEINISDISGPKSDIIKILDKYYKTIARKLKPTMARTVGIEADSQITDSKFNRVWNKYLDDINNDDKILEQSQDKFFSSVKSNNLDPATVLKPTRDDKIFFIAIIFIVRQIALAIIETCIDKGIITSLYYSLIFYLVVYTAIFIIIVIIVNIDDYKLRIIFNYFNMHINQSGMIIHLFMVIGFTMIMYLLVYYMNSHIHQVERKTINQVEKINIIYRLQLMTISVFTFVCISLLII